MRKIITVITLVLFFTSFNSFLFAERKLKLNHKVTTTLDNHLYQSLSTLHSAEERNEQLRDWIVISTLNWMQLDSSKFMDLTYDMPIYRYGYFEPLSQFKYGEGRMVALSRDTLLAFIPDNFQAKKELLADLADEFRMVTGNKPVTTLVIEYDITEYLYSIDFQLTEALSSGILFGEDYMYYQSIISSKDDLEKFLNQGISVTYAQMTGNQLIIGGRKFDNRPNLNLQNLGTLYRSYGFGVSNIFFSLDPIENLQDIATSFRGVIEKDPMVMTFLSQHYSPDGLALVNEIVRKRKSDFVKIANSLEDGNTNPLEEFQSKLEGNITSFKLSKKLTNEQLKTLDNIKKLLYDAGYEEEHLITGCTDNKALKNLLQRYRQTNNVTPDNYELIDSELYKSLLKNTLFDNNELSRIEHLLDVLQAREKYMKGTYGSGIEGTEVGMTLYYTDLMMKLWSLEDSLVVNTEIDGFRPRSYYIKNLNPIQKLELLDYKSMRSWLSLNHKAYDVHNRNTIAFTDVTTILNSRLSKEIRSTPNEDLPDLATSRFNNWWNNHYNEVADYEPEFHKLNQILKWSAIMDWLRVSKSEHLNFLEKIPNTANYFFRDWYRSQPQLQAKQSDLNIRFFEDSEQPVGETTTCMRLIDGIVGGVEKPNTYKKAVQDKSNVSSSLRRQGIDYSKSNKNTIVNSSQISSFDNDEVTVENNTIDNLNGSNGITFKTRPVIRNVDVDETKTVITNNLGVDVPITIKSDGDARQKLTGKENIILKIQQVVFSLGPKPTTKALNRVRARMFISLDDKEDSKKTTYNKSYHYILKLEGIEGFIEVKYGSVPNSFKPIKNILNYFSRSSEKSYPDIIPEINVIETDLMPLIANDKVEIILRETGIDASPKKKKLFDNFQLLKKNKSTKIVYNLNGKKIIASLENGKQTIDLNKETLPILLALQGTTNPKIINELADIDGAIVFVKNDYGLPVSFAKDDYPSDLPQKQLIEKVFQENINGQVEAIVLSSDKKGISFDENNVLSIPKDIDEKDLKTVRGFVKIVNNRPDLKEYCPLLNNIDNDAIAVLSTVNRLNPKSFLRDIEILNADFSNTNVIAINLVLQNNQKGQRIFIKGNGFIDILPLEGTIPSVPNSGSSEKEVKAYLKNYISIYLEIIDAISNQIKTDDITHIVIYETAERANFISIDLLDAVISASDEISKKVVFHSKVKTNGIATDAKNYSKSINSKNDDTDFMSTSSISLPNDDIEVNQLMSLPNFISCINNSEASQVIIDISVNNGKVELSDKTSHELKFMLENLIKKTTVKKDVIVFNISGNFNITEIRNLLENAGLAEKVIVSTVMEKNLGADFIKQYIDLSDNTLDVELKVETIIELLLEIKGLNIDSEEELNKIINRLWEIINRNRKPPINNNSNIYPNNELKYHG